jgi:Glycosyl transferase family 2
MATFSKISVLVPTRHRIERLRTLLESYERTTRGVRSASELVFRVDDDDLDTIAFLHGTRHAVLVGPREKGYESLPQFFNQLAAAAHGDVLMLGNDDITFVTPRWAPQILQAANKYKDGLFNIGVKTHNEAHFPLSVVSKIAVKQLGFLYDPRIFWGDIYLRDVMGRLGRNVVLPDVEIQHDWAGYAPDATFIEGEGARRRDWMAHHVQAVDEAEQKLRGLLRVPGPKKRQRIDGSVDGSISFIVATTCRPTIAATLASIECRPGDEIIVVSDMALNLHMQDFVTKNPYVKCMHHVAGNDWGHTERNFAMQYATGDYIAHLDDDDVYAPGARDRMAAFVAEHPRRPVIFRMEYKNGERLWRDKIVRVGNVGTPMSLVPNDPRTRGAFGSFYGGDITYLESYAARAGYASEDFVWSEDVTVLIRPHT